MQQMRHKSANSDTSIFRLSLQFVDQLRSKFQSNEFHLKRISTTNLLTVQHVSAKIQHKSATFSL
jgi:hypothetical protein